MPDESSTYYVVGYDDVRGVAVDAAATALDRYSGTALADIQSAADDAATTALQSSRDVNEQLINDGMEAVADAAASKSLQGVQDTLDQQLRTMQEQQEQSTSQVVVIDPEQYAWMQEAMQGLMGTQLVIIILLGCMCGLTLWNALARRFV